MTLGNKYALANMTLYGVMGVLYSAAEFYFPSAPTNPGPGIWVILLVPVLALVLFFIALVGRIRGNRSLNIPLVINVAALASWVFLLLF
jgi:hypothetical protein